jgi:hypothetical protein
VRVFDPIANPGLDSWTYGFHPNRSIVPMGSGAANAGYLEMWGGNVKTFPDERAPLSPNATTGWRDWIFPVQKTGGLNFANQLLGAHARCTSSSSPSSGAHHSEEGDGAMVLVVSVCPALDPWSAGTSSAVLNIWAGKESVGKQVFTASPSAPYTGRFTLPAHVTACQDLVVEITDAQGDTLARFTAVNSAGSTAQSIVSGDHQKHTLSAPETGNDFPLPVLNVVGSHFEVGYAIGQRFKQMIHARLQMREMTSELLVSVATRRY